MPRIVKKRSVKAGLPPGSLVYVGDKGAGKAKISVVEYKENMVREASISDLTECFSCSDVSTVTWIDVNSVHQVELVAKLGECFNLHPLVVEDILNTDQRPKLEDFGEYLYIVFRAFSCNGGHCPMETEQISLILGTNFVISFQEKESLLFDKILDRIRTGKGRTVKSGADYLAYSLIDTVVDNYFIVLEHLGERMEALEDALVANPASQTLREINLLKRDLISIRRSVWPLREVLNNMQREGSTLITESTRIYLRDVYDHTIHAIDTLETFRDMISGMLDIYLSSASNRLNEVMKVLTIIATIFIPLTFIVGLYGMNFRYMPELRWRWGYPAILLIMAIISACMVYYFKKKKWF
ncbi:MAG: magnesium/cobalt transporter CorA [Syntrophobacterales bacterium]|nr:MAG: magnesium/cobalt transporter CorA [Syntrophobacterales bacterium]